MTLDDTKCGEEKEGPVLTLSPVQSTSEFYLSLIFPQCAVRFTLELACVDMCVLAHTDILTFEQ